MQNRANDPLLQPFQLKHLTLRNRIITTAHEPGYAVNGMPGERYQRYHEERALGGLAASFTGAANIASDSLAAFAELDLSTDAVIPHLRKLAGRMHKHGCAMFCQLAHRGRRHIWSSGDWLPGVAPSCVYEHSHRSFPKEAEEWDIERITNDFAAAARRCVEGRMDGIEIEAYSHLMDSFWSPETNLRTDDYGAGSLQDRARFGLEVLRAMRDEVGDDPIIGLRMVVDEDTREGLSELDGIALARLYADSGLVDYLNIIKGRIDTDFGLSRMIAGMGTPTAPHLFVAARIKQAVSLPIIHAGRIADVATARHAISEGLLDLVGMTRAHMADPHIVRKIETGAEDTIRPCVGAGYCIDRIYEGGEALCVHNVATGRESRLQHVYELTRADRKRITIVGAGPAGLAAARVCAQRGHDVELYEATDRPGGQIRLAAANRRRRDMIGIVDWLVQENERLRVPVHYNRYVEADDIAVLDVDIVLVATGGLPNTAFLAEGDNLVHTTWDVLGGSVPLQGEVLVYDFNGQHPAPSCVEYMCDHYDSLQVEIVTPDRALAQGIGGTNYPAYLELVHREQIKVTTDHSLRLVRQAGNRLDALIRSDYTDEVLCRNVDHVIVEHGTIPMADLYFELVANSVNRGEIDYQALLAGTPQTVQRNSDANLQLFRLGDAVASRNVHAAILDAEMLCSTL